MANVRPLSEISEIKDIGELAKSLKLQGSAGIDAGISLAKEAASFGLHVRDYVVLAGHKLSDRSKDGLNAYEKLLVELNLPIRNDFERGVYLQAASDTFATHEGTRALFPEVVDDVVRFATRQDQFETVSPLLAGSRTINGAELLSTVIDDDSNDRDTYMIAEGAQIPVRTVRTSEKTVKIFKHGSGIRTTYEFNRRASIDLLVPYANRIARELERSKVRAATNILINGDGAYGAATVVAQSSYDTPVGAAATDGTISWKHILKWLVSLASAGTPIDTVAMNWDGWFQWLTLFGTQGANAGLTIAETLQKSGVDISSMPAAVNMALRLTPVISSAVPDNKLIGFSRGDTLEELVEAGSNIQETEKLIRNQTTTLVRTENTGYRLVYGDTRSIYDFGN